MGLRTTEPAASGSGSGAVCAGSAAIGAHYDSFWTMAMLRHHGALGLRRRPPTSGTLNWRMRFSIVMTAGAIAFLALWPSLDVMTGGKIPCPRYIEERVVVPARRRARSPRRHAARLHGRRRRSDPRQARPLLRGHAGRAREDVRHRTRATTARRTTSTRSSAESVLDRRAA